MPYTAGHFYATVYELLAAQRLSLECSALLVQMLKISQKRLNMLFIINSILFILSHIWLRDMVMFTSSPYTSLSRYAVFSFSVGTKQGDRTSIEVTYSFVLQSFSLPKIISVSKAMIKGHDFDQSKLCHKILLKTFQQYETFNIVEHPLQ